MSAYRLHAHLDVPLQEVWTLVATPTRYPEWWPRVIEVRGERFEEGDRYGQVSRGPMGRVDTQFAVDAERFKTTHLPALVNQRMIAVQQPTGFPPLHATLLDDTGKEQMDKIIAGHLATHVHPAGSN